MAGLKRRLGALEDARTRRAGQLAREALTYLSDEELDALEESLDAEVRARGEEPPPNDYLEKWKRWEAEAIEQQRRHTEESRRRDRELLERNRALIAAHRKRRKE